jgi:hypothetical protein
MFFDAYASDHTLADLPHQSVLTDHPTLAERQVALLHAFVERGVEQARVAREEADREITREREALEREAELEAIVVALENDQANEAPPVPTSTAQPRQPALRDLFAAYRAKIAAETQRRYQERGDANRAKWRKESQEERNAKAVAEGRELRPYKRLAEMNDVERAEHLRAQRNEKQARWRAKKAAASRVAHRHP